jgi:5-methylcytosine-specific restriction endonuclease McrA
MKDGNNQRKVNTNPRSQNGTLRRKYRARFKAMCAPCGICGGRLGPIHYDEPSDAAHPLSFVIDEIIPISRYKEFGYKSRRQAAEDWNNLQAAHYICNSRKGAKTQSELKTLTENRSRQMLINLSDGNW